jgi:hypothetical protein
MLTPSQTSSVVTPARKKSKKAKTQTRKAIIHLRPKKEPEIWVKVLKGAAIIAGGIGALVAFFVLTPVATAAGVAAASAIAPKATKMMMTPVK